MSATNDEIKIDLDAIDDKAKKPDPKDKAAPKDAAKPDGDSKPAPKDALSPEEGLAKLQKQLDEERTARENERRGREDAERRAGAATEGELRARTQSQADQLALISTALDSIKTANSGLKTDYAAALAAQDFDKAAEIQMSMSENAAKLIQLEAGKKHLENQPKPTARVSESTDPVERFASQLSPQSAAWVRAHPEFVTDTYKNRQMLAAHELAMGRRLKPDTPEYFASIEATLGIQKEPIKVIDDAKLDDDPSKDAASTPTKQRTPPAAPVTRSGNGAGDRSNIVTLTAAEVEIAQMNGMTVEEYAKNKAALKKEGRLN